MNHRRLFLLLIQVFVFCTLSLFAFKAMASKIEILARPTYHTLWNQVRVETLVNQVVDVNDYREVRVQIFPKYFILQVFKIGFHRVDFMRVNLNELGQVLNVQGSYHYSAEDLSLIDKNEASQCPDTDTQVIAFAPNDEPTEQAVTLDVIQSAQAKGFKVVSLLKEQATRANYLSYMTCPNLIGNFYDGDSNPQSFITVDGVINASELSAAKGLFRYHVTNIWVACEAFNNPMLSSVVTDAQAQKFAAGINDLLVGPSDQMAACAMKAAMAGQSMTQSFQDCYKQFDTANDHWGFDGHGADIFGQ